MKLVQLLLVTVLVGIFMTAGYAETYDTQAAQSAEASREAAIQKAKQVYRQTLLKADQDTIAKFKAALDAAAKSKNADDIVKIEAEIKSLQSEIASLSGEAIHVVVVANKENQQFIKVTKGATYHITAKGKWSYGTGFGFVGPDGNVTHGKDYGYLEVKIGNGAYKRIGSNGTITAEDDGALFMQMHDDPGGFDDNSGSVQVTIEIVHDDAPQP